MAITFTSRTLIAASTAAALCLGGCADMSATQKGTAAGAGIGAVGGAVIGKLAGGHTGAGAAIGGAVGAVAGNIWSKRMEEKRVAMEQATKGTGVDVSRTADNQLKVNVPSDISFTSGSAALKPELTSVLSPFAHGLDNTVTVQVVGHTDSQGGESYNQTLSLHRAESVRNYLVGQGVPSSRVLTDGRGETQPIADNTTEAGRAKNRRVEIFLREPEKAGS
jgi:outer membrane protein OmpA-like peptidoglycan-associated protein